MKLYTAFISHYGNVRSTNEDSILIDHSVYSEENMKIPTQRTIEQSNVIFAVADGMGGHAKGEVASKKVLEVLRDNIEEFKNLKYIMTTLMKAKKALNEVVKQDLASFGLGTTVSGIFFKKHRGLLFSCGDSRIYKIEGSKIQKITIDHSLVQHLYDTGVIEEDEMRLHPQKNIITSAITGDLSMERPTMFLKEIPIEVGDKFLICTDGLWESLDNHEILDCINGSTSISSIQNLITRSLTNYGKDNISVIYVEILDV